MVLVSNELENDGKTRNFAVSYEETLSLADGRDRAAALMHVLEDDFDLLSSWFPGVTLPWLTGDYRIKVFIAPNDVSTPPGSSSASWHYGDDGVPDHIITVPGDGQSVQVLQYLFLSECSEIFMYQKKNGWGYSFDNLATEGSKGEALSRFLGYQMLLLRGFDTTFVKPRDMDVANLWLETPDRYDFVNNPSDDYHPNASVGCNTLFLYYVYDQLQLQEIPSIINQSGKTISDVYHGLTGDMGDPFPLFGRLLASLYPPVSPGDTSANVLITDALNFDNPFPLALVSFWMDRSSFGTPEALVVRATQGGTVPKAFWIVLEGFSYNSYYAHTVKISTPVQDWDSQTVFTFSEGEPWFEDTRNQNRPQKIRLPFDIDFADYDELTDPGSGPRFVTLTVSVQRKDIRVPGPFIDIPGSSAQAAIRLYGGLNPWFGNLHSSKLDKDPLHSQDLRVFSMSAGDSISGAPAFTDDPYASLQRLLVHLNQTLIFTIPSDSDFLDTFQDQSGYQSTNSGVSMYNATGKKYNFAIARVRLTGPLGASAKRVRVFFRLWTGPSNETTWQENGTYPVLPGVSGPDLGLPVAPLASDPNDVRVDRNGLRATSIPLFASNPQGTSDYDGTLGGGNIRDIPITSGNSAWAYYGCFLDVFDDAGHAKWPGTHALVAQIAYNETPFDNLPNGRRPSPQTWDKLAQRNLQIG